MLESVRVGRCFLDGRGMYVGVKKKSKRLVTVRQLDVVWLDMRSVIAIGIGNMGHPPHRQVNLPSVRFFQL